MEIANSIQQALNQIEIDESTHKSVIYAKARSIIDEMGQNRTERRRAKFLVIELLGGHAERPASILKNHIPPHIVVFPDNSTARF